MRKVLAIITLVIILLIPTFFFDGIMPSIGDPDSAPNTHVSDYYIEKSVEMTNCPNMVTGILADFRGFDTMFETTVMFLAGLGAVLILSNRPNIKKRFIIPRNYIKQRPNLGAPRYKTINKDVMITLFEPLMMIYAAYVYFHGEISLGGGFQAGAVLGLAYIIDVMIVPDRRKKLFALDKGNALSIGGIGTFIYALTGILTMTGGGLCLEYDKLPFGLSHAESHSAGILMIELGVTICVMATIITILSAIMGRVRFDDDPIKRREEV